MIKTRNLLKRYGQQVVVDNINLDIQPGEIFGLLGPNGAGKSTTINMICGLLKSNQGDIVIDQLSITEKPLEAKKRLGLVPQEIALYDTLSARENVTFFGKLAGLKGRELKERVDEALEFVGLSDRGIDIPKNFSGGMKRRLNIACAIVHQPKVIIMDEPTVGIDPQSRNHILESVKKLNQRGSTILYTSHYMEEVQAICDRIAIMDYGKLIAQGTKEELRKLAITEEKIIVDAINVNYNAVEAIEKLPGVKRVVQSNSHFEIITTAAQSLLQDILFILARNEIHIRGINMVEADLETVFLSLTGRKLRD